MDIFTPNPSERLLRSNDMTFRLEINLQISPNLPTGSWRSGQFVISSCRNWHKSIGIKTKSKENWRGTQNMEGVIDLSSFHIGNFQVSAIPLQSSRPLSPRIKEVENDIFKKLNSSSNRRFSHMAGSCVDKFHAKVLQKQDLQVLAMRPVILVVLMGSLDSRRCGDLLPGIALVAMWWITKNNKIPSSHCIVFYVSYILLFVLIEIPRPGWFHSLPNQTKRSLDTFHLPYKINQGEPNRKKKQSVEVSEWDRHHGQYLK